MLATTYERRSSKRPDPGAALQLLTEAMAQWSPYESIDTRNFICGYPLLYAFYSGVEFCQGDWDEDVNDKV